MISNYRLFFRLLCGPLSIAWRSQTNVSRQIRMLGGPSMDMVCSSCHVAIWSITAISFPTIRIFKTSGKKTVTHPGSMLTFWLYNSTTMISGRRGTRRTITIVSHGTWSQRTSSWPTIRSRHKRVGLRQGPMKRSTIRDSR